ncbi:MAG: 2-C-methyl-D-erythritol 4-phosphate cytidylyltransferase [Candidatus Magnetomorum sp.]|nr:2-C-methyl-D-erythritol 4-phosphate cytidylyltransferase [Candidatus Magnetomorum sp.]
MTSSRNIAIIVAAGKGERMNSPLPKQFLMLNHHPILWHALKPFLKCVDIHQIIIAVPERFIETCQNQIIKPLLEELSMNDVGPQRIRCVCGGSRRQDSVYLGLQAIEEPASIVVIHDGVRPFITETQITSLINQAKEKKAVIFGLTPRDTIKKVNANNYITDTIDRSQVKIAQTPQAFSYPLIKRAHLLGQEKRLDATDDALLVEYLGEKVFVAPGHPLNIKITTPEDLILSQGILAEWPLKEILT